MSVDPPDAHRQMELRSTAIWNIRIDVGTGRVVAALRQRGIASIVLKGPALRDLYPEGAVRRYMDGDVWVAPGVVGEAEAVLEQIGFVPKVDERGLPGWWLEHASGWEHTSDGSAIDLHRRLQGVGVPDETAWELLLAETEPFVVGAEQALRLRRSACALYLTLHAGHHGLGHPAAITHVATALAALEETEWGRAAELASALGAEDMFAVGLRLLPEGGLLADGLGLESARSAAAHLQALTPPPVALGFEQLSKAGGRRRVEILVHKLFPPPGFIRYWWRPAARGPLLLGVGYAYRPVWLLLRAPAGWRAWRRARRVAAGTGPESDRDQPD